MVRLLSNSFTTQGLDNILKYHANFYVKDGQMHEAVAAIAATGVSPLVRIAANEGWMVKRMLGTFSIFK